MEATSYEPLVNYLRNVAQVNAFLVPNGTGLPNRLLFDMPVYSLKSDMRLRSNELRLTGDEPRMKFQLLGRTDAVILTTDSVSICRQTTCIALEVKPEGFNLKEGLREALLQLIGLNVANETHSPLVLLTNLALSHYVLYLECDNEIKQLFRLVVKKYTAFNQALWKATSLKGRECITKHFGAAATPLSSAAESESEQGDLADEFTNAILMETHEQS